jgi:hypothetical protein
LEKVFDIFENNKTDQICVQQREKSMLNIRIQLSIESSKKWSMNRENPDRYHYPTNRFSLFGTQVSGIE